MYKLFGILLLSFIFTGILAVPFINLLYALKLRRKRVYQAGREGISLSEMHREKIGTPTGGGVLVVGATILFSGLYYGLTRFQVNWTTAIFFLTLSLFGLLGVYDDLRKMVRWGKRSIKALSATHKFVLQFLLASMVAYLIFAFMGRSTLFLPILQPIFGWGPLDLGLFFIPFAAAVIVASCNAFNITDGLDGLSTGLLIIALLAYWYLAQDSVFSGDVTLFVAVLVGALLAFLYFNIHPARVFMGDSGSMALGAILAVIALVSDHVWVLPIVGGVFIAEALSSLIQLCSMRFRGGAKVFKIAPLHHHFEAVGWSETKVTMRFWLAGAVLAFAGLAVARLGILP